MALFFFSNIFLFIYFLAMVGCTQAFSGCSEWGLVFIAVYALLSVVASHVAGHRLSGTGSVVVVYGSSCSVVSGECVLLGSVSSQQRFGVTDIKALGVSQLLGLGQTML